MEAGTAVRARERREALSRQKHWLVTTGDTIGGLAGSSEDWASQGRILWEAARSETEPSVLPNLLRYQYARSKDKDKKKEKKTWPEVVFTQLSAAFKECIERAEGDDVLALDLIRHLLVYTLRSYIYNREKS